MNVALYAVGAYAAALFVFCAAIYVVGEVRARAQRRKQQHTNQQKEQAA